MFASVTSISDTPYCYANDHIKGHCRGSIDSVLSEQRNKCLTLDSKHCVTLYPQNGDRFVIIDSVTLLHPTGWVKKVSCCTVIDISKARQ